MSSPWLDLALQDYERHMAHVGQAQVLAQIFAQALGELKPHRVAVLGAAGGNGFDRLAGSAALSIVAVDINPDYLRELRLRHRDHIQNLQTVCGDLADPSLDFLPVDYIHAALVFEYVNPARVLQRVGDWLNPEGTLGVVLQLPGTAPVSPSPFHSSLEKLGPAITLQDPERFRQMADAAGLAEASGRTHTLPCGKRFHIARYQLKSRAQKE